MVLEKTLECSLDCKVIKSVNPKGNQSWIFIGRTDAEAEAQYFDHLMRKTDLLEKILMLGKIEARGEGDGRGWHGWMTSLLWGSWVWASFGSWWWTRKPGMLHSKGLQRVRHDWVAELNWTLSVIYIFLGTLAFRYVVCKLFYTSKYFILQMQLSFS